MKDIKSYRANKERYQKNMGDESKDNAPDRETAEGGLATLVDQVKDEHLVQVEDHPGDCSGC